MFFAVPAGTLIGASKGSSVRLPDKSIYKLTGPVIGRVEQPMATRYLGLLEFDFGAAKLLAPLRRVVSPGTFKVGSAMIDGSDLTIAEGTVVELLDSVMVSGK